MRDVSKCDMDHVYKLIIEINRRIHHYHIENIEEDEMKTHHDLDVWKRSIEFVKIIYTFTEKLPKDEKYGLVSQMRRCVVSIASNIAEGAARHHQKEFIQFLYHSLGSTSELETQIILANDLELVATEESILEELYRIQQMLSGLIRFLKNKR